VPLRDKLLIMVLPALVFIVLFVLVDFVLLANAGPGARAVGELAIPVVLIALAAFLRVRMAKRQ
jgi:hypothetical protein